MYFLYGLILWVALPFIVAYHCWRSFTRKRPPALPERFGFVPDEVLRPLAGSEIIWIHAVSVGETIAVTPLIRELKRRWPARKIVLSNVTETGRGVAAGIAEVDCRIYFPFDYGFAVNRLLKKVAPSVIVIVETEIWPNFLRNARRRGIPVVMVNGRISDRSSRSYRRLSRFFGPVLRNFSAFCMQSLEDARRIRSVGAEEARVSVAGNLKFDVPVARLSPEERLDVRKSYTIPPEALVFTAGSTHPGEEEQVLQVFASVAEKVGNLLLVLAPRHPERSAAVRELLRKRGIPFRSRSDLRPEQPHLRPGEVLLVDTVGELKQLYSISDVVFVGGSMVPTGGHNVLEPASFGVPVLFGPYMSNFREISAALLESGGGFQVQDQSEMEVLLTELLRDGERRHGMGEKGMTWLLGNSGAVGRVAEVIGDFLDRKGRN